MEFFSLIQVLGFDEEFEFGILYCICECLRLRGIVVCRILADFHLISDHWNFRSALSGFSTRWFIKFQLSQIFEFANSKLLNWNHENSLSTSLMKAKWFTYVHECSQIVPHLYGLDAAVVHVLLDIRKHECLRLSIGLAPRRVARPYLEQGKPATRLRANFRHDLVALLARAQAQSAQLSQWLLFTKVRFNITRAHNVYTCFLPLYNNR